MLTGKDEMAGDTKDVVGSQVRGGCLTLLLLAARSLVRTNSSDASVYVLSCTESRAARTWAVHCTL